MDDIVLEQIRSIDIGMSLTDAAGRIIAMRTQLTGFHTPNELLSMAQKLKPTTCKAVLYSNMADLIMDNKRMIEYDFDQLFYDKDNYIETEMGVTVLNPYKVWIGEGTVLKPGVILDATSGPIIIDEEAEIMANAVIIGPAYIGKNTKIKIAAKIYEGTSIGPVCKIGGEVEGSIIQAYSNKQHDGFIGHAYLGEWVNLGADTNNSDLKNNYKPVSMYSYRSQTKVNAGYQFLGSVIADHVKTGINCSLNTGVVIGMGSNLWGKDLISDYIPDFSWGEAKSLSEYRLAAFIATARIVKQRRKMEVSDLEAELYTYISKL
jgi:UDP-N-acetylglucosamine diphosphorylase/glucosamine-1-phosphate N-acetyltransferase